jgi:hypothetical protein
MISTVLWLSNDMVSLKTDVNVPTVRNKQKNLEKSFFVCILKTYCQKEQDPDP